MPTHVIETVRLSWLRSFAALMETGNQISAAVKMGCRQPNISREIALLEQWLGRDLLTTTRRREFSVDAAEILPLVQRVIESLNGEGRPDLDLSLVSLLAFVEVARKGSFSKAARDLGWTSVAINRHVRQLEFWLGRPLLKAARPVALSDQGGAFLVKADDILHQLSAIRSSEARLRKAASRLAIRRR